MATLKIELNDELYKDLKDSNINIQEKIKEYLTTLLDDGYQSICTDEAKKRVKDAVDRYKNGTGIYTPYDKDFVNKMNNYIQGL